MPYQVKEISTRCKARAPMLASSAVFCRFAGCNLWSGREKTARAPSVSSAIPICRHRRHTGRPGMTPLAPGPPNCGILGRLGWCSKPSRCHGRRAPAASRRSLGPGPLHAEGLRSRSRPTARNCPQASTGFASARRPDQSSLLRARTKVVATGGARPRRLGRTAFEHHFLQPMDGLVGQGTHRLGHRPLPA